MGYPMQYGVNPWIYNCQNLEIIFSRALPYYDVVFGILMSLGFEQTFIIYNKNFEVLAPMISNFKYFFHG